MIMESVYRGVIDYSSNGRRISVVFAEYTLGEIDGQMPVGAVYPHGNTPLSVQEVSFLEGELKRLQDAARLNDELKVVDRLVVVHKSGGSFVPTGENIHAAC